MTSSSEGSMIASTIDQTNDWMSRFVARNGILATNGDRTRNDDYFPQGDEFEEDYGGDNFSDMPSGRPYHEEDLE